MLYNAANTYPDVCFLISHANFDSAVLTFLSNLPTSFKIAEIGQVGDQSRQHGFMKVMPCLDPMTLRVLSNINNSTVV